MPTSTDVDTEAGTLPTGGPTLKPREEATLVRSEKSWNSLLAACVLTPNKPGCVGGGNTSLTNASSEVGFARTSKYMAQPLSSSRA